MAGAVYQANPTIGVPGQVYDSSPDNVIITKIATTAISYGHFVSFTNGAGTCHAPDASGEIPGADLGGIALVDESKGSGKGYAIGDTVRVLIKGRAYVANEQSMAITDSVFVRYNVSGGALGAFGTATGTSERAALTRATVFQPGAANLAVLSLR